MEDLSRIGELYYAPIDVQDPFAGLPFAPLPHNEGLTKSQRKNLKRRVAKKELKAAMGG